MTGVQNYSVHVTKMVPFSIHLSTQIFVICFLLSCPIVVADVYIPAQSSSYLVSLIAFCAILGLLLAPCVLGALYSRRVLSRILADLNADANAKALHMRDLEDASTNVAADKLPNLPELAKLNDMRTNPLYKKWVAMDATMRSVNEYVPRLPEEYDSKSRRARKRASIKPMEGDAANVGLVDQLRPEATGSKQLREVAVRTGKNEASGEAGAQEVFGARLVK